MTFAFENLDEFFDTDDFAVSASYYVWSGSAFGDATTITVIARAEGLAVDPYTGEVDNNVPVAIIKTSEVTGAKPEDKINFGSVNYRVVEVMPDGTGITKLTLAKM